MRDASVRVMVASQLEILDARLMRLSLQRRLLFADWPAVILIDSGLLPRKLPVKGAVSARGSVLRRHGLILLLHRFQGGRIVPVFILVDIRGTLRRTLIDLILQVVLLLLAELHTFVSVSPLLLCVLRRKMVLEKLQVVELAVAAAVFSILIRRLL